MKKYTYALMTMCLAVLSYMIGRVFGIRSAFRTMSRAWAHIISSNIVMPETKGAPRKPPVAKPRSTYSHVVDKSKGINGIPTSGGVNDCWWNDMGVCRNPKVTKGVASVRGRDMKSTQSCTLTICGCDVCSGYSKHSYISKKEIKAAGADNDNSGRPGYATHINIPMGLAEDPSPTDGESHAGQRAQSPRQKSLRTICLVCGREFKTTPAQAKVGHGKYCSIKCSGEARRVRVQVACQHCGKDINVIPSKQKTTRYCSRACYNAALKKPPIYRKCIVCGKIYKAKLGNLNKGRGLCCSVECGRRTRDIKGVTNE